MPLVKRTVEIDNESTTYQKGTVEHVHYIPPGQVRSDDVVVEPSSDVQLAELAEKYPAEFSALAKDRGVTPGHESGEDGRVAAFMAKPVKDLVKAIRDLDAEGDAVLLIQLFEAETSDEGENRAAVLQALAKQGAAG